MNMHSKILADINLASLDCSVAAGSVHNQKNKVLWGGMERTQGQEPEALSSGPKLYVEYQIISCYFNL